MMLGSLCAHHDIGWAPCVDRILLVGLPAWTQCYCLGSLCGHHDIGWVPCAILYSLSSRCDEGVGWVPCMHLRELSTSSNKAYAREMGREKALMTMNNIFAITGKKLTNHECLFTIHFNPLVLRRYLQYFDSESTFR